MNFVQEYKLHEAGDKNTTKYTGNTQQIEKVNLYRGWQELRSHSEFIAFHVTDIHIKFMVKDSFSCFSSY